MNALLTMSSGYFPAVEERRPGTSSNEWAAKARHVALLAAAPFIGFVYAVGFPIMGLAMLAWIGFRALPKPVKNVMLFFAAPFIGLAYAVAFPFVGLAMLARIGARAMLN